MLLKQYRTFEQMCSDAHSISLRDILGSIAYKSSLSFAGSQQLSCADFVVRVLYWLAKRIAS